MDVGIHFLTPSCFAKIAVRPSILKSTKLLFVRFYSNVVSKVTYVEFFSCSINFLTVCSYSRVEFYLRVISVNCQPHPALRKSPSVRRFQSPQSYFLSVFSPMKCRNSQMPSFFTPSIIFLAVENCSRVAFYFRVISVNCQPHSALRKLPYVRWFQSPESCFFSSFSPVWCQVTLDPEQAHGIRFISKVIF